MQLTSPEDAFCQSSLGEIIHVVSIIFFTILDKKNLQKKFITISKLYHHGDFNWKKLNSFHQNIALYQVWSHADLEMVLEKIFYIIISPRIGAFFNQ